MKIFGLILLFSFLPNLEAYEHQKLPKSKWDVVPFHTVGDSDCFNLPEGFYTVRSDDEWNDFWAKFVGGSSITPEIPEVDFSKSQVLAYARHEGHRWASPTGRNLEFEKVYVRKNGYATMHAMINYTKPGDGCVMLPTLMNYCQIIVVPKQTNRVHYDLIEKTIQCR